MVTEGLEPTLAVLIGKGVAVVHLFDIGFWVELARTTVSLRALEATGTERLCLFRTSSPSRKVRFKLSATCFAIVDLPHAVAPVKKTTYRGRSAVGFSPMILDRASITVTECSI